MQVRKETITMKEQKVLEITEEEFLAKGSEAATAILKKDCESKIADDPIMMMALTLSYAQVISKLHDILFEEEQNEQGKKKEN